MSRNYQKIKIKRLIEIRRKNGGVRNFNAGSIVEKSLYRDVNKGKNS